MSGFDAKQPFAAPDAMVTTADAGAGGAPSAAPVPAAGGAAAGGAAAANGARRRNRTNYRCSKCGQPKRGHICPYQPRVLRADGETPPDMKTVATQVEIDERLVVRHLHLPQQGYPESYGEAPAVMPPMPLFDAGGGLPMQFAGHPVAMPPQAAHFQAPPPPPMP
jgi:hypothetical protein